MATSHARTIYQLKPKGRNCFVVWRWGLNTSESGSQSIATTDGLYVASRLLPLFPLFMWNFTVICDCQWSGLKAKKSTSTHTHCKLWGIRPLCSSLKNKITRPGNNKKNERRIHFFTQIATQGTLVEQNGINRRTRRAEYGTGITLKAAMPSTNRAEMITSFLEVSD